VQLFPQPSFSKFVPKNQLDTYKVHLQSKVMLTVENDKINDISMERGAMAKLLGRENRILLCFATLLPAVTHFSFRFCRRKLMFAFSISADN